MGICTKINIIKIKIKLIFVGKAWSTQFLELEFHSCFLRFMTARNHMQGANLYLNKYYYNNAVDN